MYSTSCVCVARNPDGSLRYRAFQSGTAISEESRSQVRMELARFVKEFRENGTPLSEQRSAVITIAPLDVDELEVLQAEHSVSWGKMGFDRVHHTWILQLVEPVLYADLHLSPRDLAPAWLDILMEVSQRL